MSLDEAKTAVLNAARALRQAFPPGESSPVPRSSLGQLYSAVDACDAVGDAAPDAPYGAQEARSVAQASEVGGFTVRGAEGRSARFCSEWDCWRVADLPTGTCHHHAPIAQKPHPWEQAQMREPVFEVRDGDG